MRFARVALPHILGAETGYNNWSQILSGWRACRYHRFAVLFSVIEKEKEFP
jgi:hypothetical protein